MDVRGFTVKLYSKIKAWKRRDEEKIRKINELIKKAENIETTGKSCVSKLYQSSLGKDNGALLNKTRGTIIRNRARCQEHGERNNKIFLEQ